LRASTREAGFGGSARHVSAGQIAAACPAPWHGRLDLVTQALVLLERHALVLVAAGSTRAWKITAAGWLMLTPPRGRARERPIIGGGARAGALRLPAAEVRARAQT
jgi:hypothetical protein